MIILLVLLLLVPAALSVLLYEQFIGYELSYYKRITLHLIIAYLINMISYTVIWLRGWTQISWTLDISSVLLNVSFCIKYMSLSLVSAVIIPFVLRYIKIGKHK